jgi:hypothetical protein
LPKNKNIAKEVFVKENIIKNNLILPSKPRIETNKNRLFDEAEFLALGVHWLQQGLIDSNDLILIQKTVADNEAKKLLQLWSLVFPVSMTVNYFRDSATATVGLVTRNIWQSLKTYLGIFLGLGAIQGGFAAYYLRGLKSQKIVPWLYFIPILGVFAPLGYLTKEHNRFLHLLWGYLHTKTIFRTKNQIPKQTSLQSHIYDQQLKQSFQTAMNRISPVLNFAQGVWKTIEKILPKNNNKT